MKQTTLSPLRTALVCSGLALGSALVVFSVQRALAQPDRPSSSQSGLQQRIDDYNGYDRHPLVLGDHDQAMDQAARLLDRLREVDWNWSKVEFDLQRLPDMRFSPRESDRTRTTSFAPARGSDADRMAFWSPTYLRSRLIAGADGKFSRKTDGFVIVVWKDGRIEKVPAADIRATLVLREGEWTVEPAFPGLERYDTSAPGVDDGQRISDMIQDARRSDVEPASR